MAASDMTKGSIMGHLVRYSIPLIQMCIRDRSKGELNTVCQAVGGLDKLLDDKCRDKDALALIRYIAEEDRAEKLSLIHIFRRQIWKYRWRKNRKRRRSGRH